MPVGDTDAEMIEFGWKKAVILPKIDIDPVSNKAFLTEYWFHAERYPCGECVENKRFAENVWVQVVESGIFWVCATCKQVMCLCMDVAVAQPKREVSVEEARHILAISPFMQPKVEEWIVSQTPKQPAKTYEKPESY